MAAAVAAEPQNALAHVDLGMVLYQNKDLNGANHGLGLEYRFSGTMAATAGRFYNSDREYSNYAGVIWQPWALGPVRIGADSDWAAIFATDSVSIGLKRDGSVWKWGALAVGPNGWQGWKGGAHPKPENWNLDGTGWLAHAGGPRHSRFIDDVLFDV